MMSLMLVVKFCFGTGSNTTYIEQITILAHEDPTKVLFVNSFYGEIQFLSPVFNYFTQWLNIIKMKFFIMTQAVQQFSLKMPSRIVFFLTSNVL